MKYLVKIIGIAFFVSLCVLSCKTKDENADVEAVLVEQKTDVELNFAKGFTIEERNRYKIITLNEAWKDVDNTYKYVLYKNEKPKGISDAVFIKVPIKSIACMSLTHVAFLEKMGLENTIVGISGCDYVSNEKVRIKIKNNLIKELGQEQNINYEVLTDSSPDVVMSYGINSASSASLNKMKELDLAVVLNSEYMETHPLGKAEWIKFVAAFYDKSEIADSIFKEIEREYVELTKLTSGIDLKPTVFTGMPWSGSWYVPGGKSFQAQLFADAGSQYLWADNEEKSSLIKAKEVIIDEAYNADFWLNLNSYSSVSDVVDFDNKFKGFSSIKKEQLYNNNVRLNGKGGNDYWESGVINPQIVLKDLIEIFHPEILEHNLYYYRKLE